MDLGGLNMADMFGKVMEMQQKMAEAQQALDLEEVSRLTFIVREDLEPAAPEEAVPDVDPQEYMQQKRQESPVIQAIFEQFGGEMVW